METKVEKLAIEKESTPIKAKPALPLFLRKAQAEEELLGAE